MEYELLLIKLKIKTLSLRTKGSPHPPAMATSWGAGSECGRAGFGSFGRCECGTPDKAFGLLRCLSAGCVDSEKEVQAEGESKVGGWGWQCRGSVGVRRHRLLGAREWELGEAPAARGCGGSCARWQTQGHLRGPQPSLAAPRGALVSQPAECGNGVTGVCSSWPCRSLSWGATEGRGWGGGLDPGPGASLRL